MIRSLAGRKYKLVEGGQSETEKQYLPMDLFYTHDITQSDPLADSDSSRVNQRQGRLIAHRLAVVDGQIRLAVNPDD